MALTLNELLERIMELQEAEERKPVLPQAEMTKLAEVFTRIRKAVEAGIGDLPLEAPREAVSNSQLAQREQWLLDLRYVLSLERDRAAQENRG